MIPFLWLALLPAPQGTPSFPTEVEVITVDAVVVDKDGRPVTGLTRDEFRVLEDGKPQEIVSFEPYERGEPGGEDEVEPTAIATNERGTELRGRAFALLLDDVFTPLQGSAEVRQAVESFLRNSVGPGDEVTIATTSGNAYWSAGLPEGLEDLLAVAARFKGRDTGGRYGTQDYPQTPGRGHALRHAGAQAHVRGGGLQIERGPIADEINHIRIQRMKVTLAAVRRQLDALATVRGRKSLILMSPGFLQDDTLDIRETAAASRRANTALYFVDVRGLMGQEVFSAANKVGGAPTLAPLSGEEGERNLVTAGTQMLAQDTGGFSIQNVNDFGAATARIAAESRSYYLLGIHPAQGKGARDWRKLTVEVTRPGLKVRARRGYTLRDAPPPEEADPQKGRGKGKSAGDTTRKTLDPAVAGALDAAHAVSGIPLRAMVYVMEPGPRDTTRVLVAAEFDPLDLGKRRELREARLQHQHHPSRYRPRVRVERARGGAEGRGHAFELAGDGARVHAPAGRGQRACRGARSRHGRGGGRNATDRGAARIRVPGLDADPHERDRQVRPATPGRGGRPPRLPERRPALLPVRGARRRPRAWGTTGRRRDGDPRAGRHGPAQGRAEPDRRRSGRPRGAPDRHGPRRDEGGPLRPRAGRARRAERPADRAHRAVHARTFVLMDARSTFGRLPTSPGGS